MENNTPVVEETAIGTDVAVNTPKDTEVKVEKTFTRDEYNKAIAAEKAKVRAEIEKEQEEKRTESEKLARMDEKQKIRL